MPAAKAPPPGQSKTKRRKRKDSDNDSQAEGGSFEVYQSAAMTFQNTGQFGKAIDNYTKALDLRDGDKNCLVARSQCYLQLGDAERGLADAWKTLEDDKNYIKGILQQAESYYQMGQFEYALMHYHRGNKLRPEKQAFRLGIQKSQEAIDNSIGDAASIKLTKAGDLSYFYEEQQKAAKSQQQQKRAGYTRPGSRERKKQQKRRKEGQDQKTVKQLLGDLYSDKEYLEQLLKETQSAGNQSETNKDVHTLAEDCLNYLDTRTSFWQQQQPMYSRKGDKKQKQKIQKAQKKDIADWVLMRLNQIDEAQAEGNYDESLKLSKKTLKEVDKWSDDDLPNRREVVANLHSCHGNAYLEMGEYGKALHHHTVDNEIGEQRDIDESKSRSLDNIGRVYARMGNYEKAIEVWEKKAPLVKSALECTWLYHEIGRCHLELKNYDHAKEFGTKSLEAADEAGDEVWQLNATVLIAQCEVKLKEFQSAVDSFDKALEMAKVQGDKAAESAIRKAIEDVNQRIVNDIKGSQDGDGEKRAIEDKDEEKGGKSDEKAERDYTDDEMTEKDIQNLIKSDKNDSDKQSEPHDIRDKILEDQDESFFDTDDHNNSDRQSDHIDHSGDQKKDNDLSESEIREQMLDKQDKEDNSDSKSEHSIRDEIKGESNKDNTDSNDTEDKNVTSSETDNQKSDENVEDIRDKILQGQDNQSKALGRENTVETQVAKDKKKEEAQKEKPVETNTQKKKDPSAANDSKADATNGNKTDTTNGNKTNATDGNSSDATNGNNVNDKGNSANSSVNSTPRGEPVQKDTNFWDNYNAAVDDKVKYGEISHGKATKQPKRRNQSYGYQQSSVSTTSKKQGDVDLKTSSKGFNKEYEYDFEGTKSKFDGSSNETDDEKKTKKPETENKSDDEKDKTEEEKK